MRLVLTRYSDDGEQTIGNLYVTKDSYIVDEFHSLELSWKNNESFISCIPKKTYKVKKRWSEKYGWHFHVLDVEDRDYILIHSANYVFQIKGCIAVGLDLMDINGDGLIDVTHSKDAMESLLDLMPEDFEMEVTSI